MIEIHGNAILLLGGPNHIISVDGELFHFEMNSFCGPVLTDEEDEILEDQKPNHKFWEAVSHWAQQGQSVGADGLCIYEWPGEDILEHLGGRNYRVLGQHPPRKGD